VTTRASAIRDERTELLVPGVPRGEASAVVGPPGIGKGTWAADFQADVTTGRSGLARPGSVLLVSPEENAGATIRPRLARSGADLDRVHLVQGVRNAAGRVDPFEVKRHVDAIRRSAEGIPDLLSIILDPVNACLGSGVNSKDEDDVRGVLQPLVDLARERQLAMVWISHLRKGQANDASSVLDRIAGSAAFGRMPRVVWYIDREDDASEVRLMLPVKYSLGRWPGGRKFRIVGPDDQPGTLEWLEGEVDVSAEDLADRDGRKRARAERVKRAEAFLRDALASGQRLTTEVEAEAERAGIGERDLKAARANLNVLPEKATGSKTSPWMLRLPDAHGVPE
jgi:hypothetical protein